MSPDRGNGGRFAPKVDDADVLRALRDHAEPVATTGDLADALDVGSETVRRRLTDLHDVGKVGRKEVGSRAVVWWAIDGEMEDAPAAPLKQLVGVLNEEAADRARARSDEWRREFNQSMNPDEK